MSRTPTILFLTALVIAAALLSGCGSSGVGDVLGGSRSNAGDVRGTVTSVDTRDRTIVVDQEGTGYYLRNGGSDEVVLHYDDRTTVDYQGRTFRPEDLERGDRITANVDESSSRLYAQDIQVLYDVSGGTGESGGTVNDRGTLGGADLRGVVRSVDTRGQTLEIAPSRYDSRFSTGRSSDVVVVHYDSQTAVEYQGRNYAPENLEQGDEVEVDIRDSGGRLLAEQIVVVGENQPTR